MNLATFLQRNYSALRGPARALGLLHFLDSMGNGLFISGSAVYFVVVAGLPPGQIGLGLSLAGLTGFFSSVLVGMAADRYGARRLLVLAMPAMAGAYCLYLVVDSFAAFLAVVVLVGALEWGSGPLFHTLIMDLVPADDRVPARAALRSLYNVGFSAGALLAAGLIGIGGGAMYLLPLGNALSFVLAAAIALRLPRTPPVPPEKNRTARFRALRDAPFVAVIGVSGLLALHGAVLFVGIPLWLVDNGALPHAVIPLGFAMNTVAVVLFQVAAARGAETLDGAVGAARRAGLASAAACFVLVVGDAGGVWVTGVVVLAAVLLITGGELWQSASAFGLSFGLAPDSARGEYLGAFHLHMVFQATVGPAVVSFLVTGHGPAGWFATGLIFLAGTVLIGPAVRRTRGHRRGEPALTH
ncbi:MAG TPA: MFS transporter [Actinophytocola sp.]|uniref:MFS transporter n=1 Tax=Actinophytocola sp. TaxID=1872138 RepID=UPI002DBC79C3|nr:MFS transporter [Actinophytocola sp.]HEU5469199.1 MFS transporter [Actinophytocola sp.]